MMAKPYVAIAGLISGLFLAAWSALGLVLAVLLHSAPSASPIPLGDACALPLLLLLFAVFTYAVFTAIRRHS